MSFPYPRYSSLVAMDNYSRSDAVFLIVYKKPPISSITFSLAITNALFPTNPERVLFSVIFSALSKANHEFSYLYLSHSCEICIVPQRPETNLNSSSSKPLWSMRKMTPWNLPVIYRYLCRCLTFRDLMFSIQKIGLLKFSLLNYDFYLNLKSRIKFVLERIPTSEPLCQ